MSSTVIITRTLRDANIDLLREVRDRAEAGGLEPEHHIVSVWSNALLRTPEDLTRALVSAQNRFRSYAPANSRWLEALDALLSYGGDERVPDFAKNLLRAFLFHLQPAADALWTDYQEMQRQVIIETGRRLPPTWGEWIVPMQMFMGLLETRLVAENPVYQLLLVSDVARELALGVDGARPQADRSLVAVPLSDSYSFDLIATLSTYLNWCIKRIGMIDPGGYARTPNPSVPLDEVFVPLRLAPLGACRPERGYARFWEATCQPPPAGLFPTEADLEACEPITVSQALASMGRVLILGPTGAGKSTLLRHLALEHAKLMRDDLSERPQGIDSPADLADRGSARVPIYLSLAAFIEHRAEDESLTDFVLRSLDGDLLRDSQVAEVLLGVLQAGHCLVLFDDLDAALDDKQRRTLITAISDFATQWCEYGNQVVVSSRLADWSAQLGAGFRAFVLRPLDRSQTGSFALKWLLTLERAGRPMIGDDELRHLAHRQTVALLSEISASERLQSLASNPLALRMMIGASRQGVYLPGERVALYEVAADALIREWRLPEGAPAGSAVTGHEATTLLSELAYWLHSNRPTGLASEHEVVRRLSDLWLEMYPQATQDAVDEAIDEFMSRLRHYNGVLVEVESRRYGFISRAFQEYFAARWLVWRSRTAALRIRPHLHDPRWEDVISLAVGFVSLYVPADASELIETAILARGPDAAADGFRPSPYEEVLQRDLFFAARLLGGEVRGETEVVQHIAERLADLWLHADRDSLGRFSLVADQARGCLIRLGGTTGGCYALHRMIEGLASPSEHVRAYAADGLSFWPEHAYQAVEALTGHGDDPSPLVKRAIAEALGRLRVMTRETYNCLIRLASDPDAQVAEAANRTLEGAPPVPESELRLWVELLRDENPANRRLGARVLQRIGRLPPLVVGELLNLIGDPNPSVREAVTKALARVATLNDDALNAICRAIDNDERTSVQVAAIGALSRPVVLPDVVIERLIEWARDANPEVRVAVAGALGTCLNDTELVMRTLVRLLDDPVETVRQRIVEVLAIKGRDDPDIVHTLLHSVRDESPGVRISLGRSLGTLREMIADVRRTLLALLNDHHYSVREAAMRSVAEVPELGEPIVQRLVALVREQAEGGAPAALDALTTLRGLPTYALAALVDVLPNHVETHGDCIAECLRAHSPLGAEVVHPLVDLALRGAGIARRLAIDVIGYSLDSVPGVLKDLMQLADDPNSEVRRVAILSLSHASQLPDHATVKLFQFLGGEELEVRQAAAVALARLSRRLPRLWMNQGQVITVANRLYALLHELTPRAAWEPGGEAQNETLNALSWVARCIPGRD